MHRHETQQVPRLDDRQEIIEFEDQSAADPLKIDSSAVFHKFLQQTGKRAELSIR